MLRCFFPEKYTLFLSTDDAITDDEKSLFFRPLKIIPLMYCLFSRIKKGLKVSQSAYIIKIKGRVTGVAFRYSALEKSLSLPSITGYIRNASHGEVETFIQGENEDLNKMIIWLRQGPPLARIDNFEISECPVNKNLNEFKITY